MSLGLFNCRLIQPARDQLFFFAGCLAAPVPVRASSVQSPCDASCSAPTSGRARNASCVFPSQEGFVLVFTGSEAPVGCRRVHPTDSPTNSPEDPPILPIDSAIEPILLTRETVAGEFRSKVKHLHRVLKPILHGLLRNVSGFKAFHQVRAAHAAEEIQSSAFDLQIEAFGNGDSATRAEFRGVPEKVIECVIESCMHAPAEGSLIIFSGVPTRRGVATENDAVLELCEGRASEMAREQVRSGVAVVG